MVILLVFLSVLISSVSAQLITLSGIVKDSSTLQVIPGTEVTLLKKGIVFITGNDGEFVINTEITASRPPISDFTIHRQSLPQQNVCLSRYSLSGQRLYSVNKVALSGTTVVPRQNSASGYYISRIQAGTNSIAYGDISFGKTTNITGNFNFQSESSKKSAGTVAVKNAIDTLRFQKKGYITKYLPITSSITDTIIFLKPIEPERYTGYWTGYTIEGAPISFKIDSLGKIRCIRYELGISGLTSIITDSITSDSGLTQITGDRFLYVSTDDNISGIFSGDTLCAGSIRIGKFSVVERSFLVRKVRESDNFRSDLFILITQTSAGRGYTFFPDDTVYVVIKNPVDAISIKLGTYSSTAKVFIDSIAWPPDSFSNQIQFSLDKNVIPLKIISSDGLDSCFYWVTGVSPDNATGHEIQGGINFQVSRIPELKER